MKRIFVCAAVAAAFTLGFHAQASAAGLKIGYLDVTGAAAGSQWGKKITSDLKSEQAKLSSAVQEKTKAYNSARDEFVKERDAMNAKSRSRKENQLRNMAGSLQQLLVSSQRTWDSKKKAEMAPLFKKVFEIARKIAKRDRFDIIIDSNALIVRPGKKYDITPEVIKEQNREEPR